VSSSLSHRAVRGVIWTGSSQLIRQIFSWLVTVVLARLLVPEDFGIVGMTAIFTGFIGQINELGLSAAIIQKKDLTDSHLHTSFWTSLAAGVMLCGVSIGLSPLAADFFNKPLVQPVMAVSSAGFIIGSFGIVHRAILKKKLEFKKIAAAEIGGTVAYGLVAISLAFAGKGVWSLVGGGLSKSFVSVLVLYKSYNWYPRAHFNYSRFKDLFRFGRNVMGANLMYHLSSNIDYLIVGRLLGASVLGYYTLAYNLATFPLRKISLAVTKVTFPTFSEIQNENEKLQQAYLKSVTYISLVTFPLLAGLLSIAPEFVKIIYGEKWGPAILPLQILCIAGALYSVGATVGSIYLSKGRADLEFKLSLFRFMVLGLLAIAGSKFGIIGIASAVTIYCIISLFIFQAIANSLISLRMKDYFLALLPSTLGSIAIVGVIIAYRQLQVILALGNYIFLITSVLLGVIIYLMVLRLINIRVLSEMLKLILGSIRARSHAPLEKTLL